MKDSMKNLLLVALMVAATPSCLSQRARDEALLPAMNLAWTGVRADLERGLDDAVEDGDLVDRASLDLLVVQLEEALDSGSRGQLLLVPWASTLLPYAERGIQDRIDDGQMSDMVAESLRERLRNFTVGFGQLIAVNLPKERWLPNGSQITHVGTVTLAGDLVTTNPYVLTTD